MIITQKKYRKLREDLDCIQSIICDLKLYGIYFSEYKDCPSNAIFLISCKLEQMGLDSSFYVYQIILPPYQYDSPQRLVLRIRWNNIDDYFKSATAFVLEKIRHRAMIHFSHNT